jgi:hypothetical protein
VFIIQPTNTPYQRVTWESLAPSREIAAGGDARRARQPPPARARGAGPFKLRYDAIVDLVHHFALPADLREVPIAELPAAVLPYIYPSRYCQSDRLMDVARAEFGSMVPAMDASRRSASGCRSARSSRSARAIPGLPPWRRTSAARGCAATFAHPE